MLTDLDERLNEVADRQPFVPDVSHVLERARRRRRHRRLVGGSGIVLLAGAAVAAGVLVAPFGGGPARDRVVTSACVSVIAGLVVLGYYKNSRYRCLVGLH